MLVGSGLLKKQQQNVEAIRQFPRPATVKGLQEFFGMLNFRHRFVPAAVRIMRPLFNYLAG